MEFDLPGGFPIPARAQARCWCCPCPKATTRADGGVPAPRIKAKTHAPGPLCEQLCWGRARGCLPCRFRAGDIVNTDTGQTHWPPGSVLGHYRPPRRRCLFTSCRARAGLIGAAGLLKPMQESFPEIRGQVLQSRVDRAAGVVFDFVRGTLNERSGYAGACRRLQKMPWCSGCWVLRTGMRRILASFCCRAAGSGWRSSTMSCRRSPMWMPEKSGITA